MAKRLIETLEARKMRRLGSFISKTQVQALVSHKEGASHGAEM